MTIGQTDLALISITSEGFVCDACFDDLNSCARWSIAHKRAGNNIQKVRIEFARRVLFTSIDLTQSTREVVISSTDKH